MHYFNFHETRRWKAVFWKSLPYCRVRRLGQFGSCRPEARRSRFDRFRIANYVSVEGSGAHLIPPEMSLATVEGKRFPFWRETLFRFVSI